MTTTDATLATTFEPMACMDCQSQGLTVEQCAVLIHAEQMLKIALADRAIEQAETPEQTMLQAQTKAAAIAVNRKLDVLRDRPTRVAILTADGLPLTVIDSTDRRFQRELACSRLLPTSEQHVFRLA